MRTTLLITALFFTAFDLSAQTTSLKKHSISNSGCSVYNFCEPKYKLDYSTDSSHVFTGECMNGDVTYGVICIRLMKPVSDLIQAEDLMIAYLDYLKGTFSITKSVGYGRGHRLNKNENTRGIIDYWEDAEQDKWKIKSWTDGKYIGFMYVYSKKDIPDSKVNPFLDGFRLPD